MGAYVMDDYRRALLGDHDCFTDKCQEAHRMALSALRPVSREQVERIRGKWETTADAEEELKNFSCSSCGYLLCDVDTAVIMPVENDFYFCPNCGAPMTDEAVEIVVEKINNMEEMTNEH